MSQDANEYNSVQTEAVDRFGAETEASTLGSEARVMFGENALTAVAYCGLDAWLEGNQQESQLWGCVLKRLVT